MRTGYGGQAKEMRDEPNAIGVRTKKLPGRFDEHFWSDVALKENVKKINEDLTIVQEALKNGKIVIMPLDGLGTGLSELEKRAPLTALYLNFKLKKLKDKYK